MFTVAAGQPLGRVDDPEPVHTLGRRLGHLDPRHASARWTPAAPHDHRLDRLWRALEDRFDAAVGSITHPPRDATGEGFAPAAVPEQDALDLPVDEHSTGDDAQSKSSGSFERRTRKSSAGP